MQNSKVGKYNIWYENSDEFYELKKEIFGENCYYLELEKENPTIIDAGAHIGLTVLYFKMLFPKARIIAFEPIPANFELLQKNIEENQLENVEIYQAVIAPKSGILRIHEPIGESAWKSGAGIIPKGWRGIQTNKEIKVEAIGISEILREQIDLFKMDIEGMEYEVIRNMGDKMRMIKNLMIEVHPRKDHRIDEIKKILSQNGYKFEVREDPSSMGRGLTKIIAVLK
ncbi:MAG: FkbM family methyltransferase [Microgenomates group bacterium]